jgi:hypothetical protein
VGQLKANGVPLREIGSAGGDSLNGMPLSELTRCWQAKSTSTKDS